jgi:hypothetical protein
VGFLGLKEMSEQPYLLKQAIVASSNESSEPKLAYLLKVFFLLCLKEALSCAMNHLQAQLHLHYH